MQEEVFNQTLAPVVKDVLKGFESTVFAYGQTGTGVLDVAVAWVLGVGCWVLRLRGLRLFWPLWELCQCELWDDREPMFSRHFHTQEKPTQWRVTSASRERKGSSLAPAAPFLRFAL